MSFLLDGPLLAGAGAAVGASDLDADQVRRVEIGTIALFWVVSISLYCNATYIEWLGRCFGGRSGRDFQVNSGWFGLGLLRFDPSKGGLRRTLVVLMLFASYPLWFRLGMRVGRRIADKRAAIAPPSVSEDSPIQKL